MNDVQTKLNYVEAVADYFLELGRNCINRGKLDDSLKLTSLAANILSRQNRILSSERLESNLRLVARELPTLESSASDFTQGRSQEKTCLHVLAEAHRAGGLTAMALRWIMKDQGRRKHSVALLSQKTPLPDDFRQVVMSNGGRIYLADPKDSVVEKACWLRGLSRSVADFVILHIGTDDVICGAAFGVNGGPPVLLVNHAAHTFWTGASIVDLVINCRGSNYEEMWTVRHRGIPRCATVPIPLQELSLTSRGIEIDSEERTKLRLSFGIASESVLMITVGAQFKYNPIQGCDFLSIFESILGLMPETYLYCAGFHADVRWNNACARLNGRIKCLGVLSQTELSRLHSAADIYIEGFPFGTTTALLEAGLKGIPVVFPPSICPPPYASDGVALDAIVTRAKTLEEYKANIVNMVRRPDERHRMGKSVSSAIIEHHTGPRWLKYLEVAFQALPLAHSTYPLTGNEPTDSKSHEYWAEFSDMWGVGYSDVLEHSLYNAVLNEFKPRISKKMIESLKKQDVFRIKGELRIALLRIFFNILLPVLPMRIAEPISRMISFLCRPMLMSRVRNRVHRIFEKRDVQRHWYGEYRTGKPC